MLSQVEKWDRYNQKDRHTGRYIDIQTDIETYTKTYIHEGYESTDSWCNDVTSTRCIKVQV